MEKVYENALVIELRACGFEVQQQARMQVMYQGQVVGDIHLCSSAVPFW